jgi:hypothetical protein
VTPGSFISTGTSSMVWSASVPLCGPHGLAVLQNPPHRLISLLEKHNCCGKCCPGDEVQNQDSSSSVEGAGDGSGLQAAAGCTTTSSCSSCTLQVAFKFARPFAQLAGADKAAYGNPDGYVDSMGRCYAKEWSIIEGCSSCVNVLSGFAVGELRNGNHARPCMLFELSQLGDANILRKQPSSMQGWHHVFPAGTADCPAGCCRPGSSTRTPSHMM